MADTRSSALFKRAEQLKRWEESDTNRQSTVARRPSKIKFSSGCVFLAACASGDKEEVLRLLQTGADINTANVDGLTALHQACIDDNLDMVEFLVARGADVNRGDNEGWTPLHATASCGFISIARFLLESNADVAAVNYDGELPVDIAESETMEELLQKVIDEKGVDCEAARNAEVSSLLADARKWAAYGYVEMQDPKTGGTPLHVAAAKGYVDVANVLLEQCGVDPDCVDFDGWTPLHAAALWGQKEAAAALIKHGADIDLKNYSGQSCMDLVEPSLSAWLEEARAAAGRNNNNNNKHKHKRGPPPSRDPPLPNHKLKRVELQITNQPESILNDKKSNSTEIMPKVPDGKPPKGRAASPDTTNEQSNTEINANNTEEAPSWRRSASFRSRQNDATRDSKSISTNSTPTSDDTILRRTHSFENDKAFYQRYRDVTARIKASSCPSIPPPPAAPPTQPADTNRQSEPQANTNTDTNEGPQLRNNAGERREREANTWAAPASAAQVAVRRSFVPPVRDEESETQRKAHAKRVRETRRSTQGVTLDEIKSAEQLVKKKSNNDTTATVTTTVPVTTTTATVPLSKAEEKENSTFELEEVSGPGSPRSASPRLGSPAHPAADTTVTLPLRRTVTATTTTSASPTPAAHNDDKGDAEQTDKKSAEGSERGGSGGGAGSTQAALNVIQRRRRPKRRSTGVGHFDMDEIVNERGGSGEGDSEGDVSLSGSERTSDAGDATAASAGKGSRDAAAEGEKAPDYRALWEASQLEVRRLRDLLTTSEQQLRDSRGTIARLTQVNQNSLTELEKREKRAMERKLSEMEEELKQLQKLKAENERLRAENRALTRVVSKLTNSAGK